MKKIKTYSEQILIESDGLIVRGWKKTCPVCGSIYQTTSRGQKFCSEACCKKFNTKRRKQKKQYDSTKEVSRLSARSHSVASEVIKQLVSMGIRTYQCEVCGSTSTLQVHHINSCWLDNTPSNLQILCPKCHASVHSSPADYDPSFTPILSILNRNLQ